MLDTSWLDEYFDEVLMLVWIEMQLQGRVKVLYTVGGSTGAWADGLFCAQSVVL